MKFSLVHSFSHPPHLQSRTRLYSCYSQLFSRLHSHNLRPFSIYNDCDHFHNNIHAISHCPYLHNLTFISTSTLHLSLILKFTIVIQFERSLILTNKNKNKFIIVIKFSPSFQKIIVCSEKSLTSETNLYFSVLSYFIKDKD